jgi:hypothetical protein
MVVKKALNMPPEQLRKSLKTFTTWAPLFNGSLPYIDRKDC